jgi:CelD/BcsL family acetyltransferase involved in cellulose biosynthesis
MHEWQRRRVKVKFKLGERTLFTRSLWLKVRDVPLRPDLPVTVEHPEPPGEALEGGCAGYLIRSLPVRAEQSKWRTAGSYISYTPLQYQRYYIDLRQTFSAYRSKFSSKSRSTLTRKVRKFAEQFGGEVRWRCYGSCEEMRDFYRLARMVSAKTYQERLLDAGLPESPAFLQEIEALAARGLARGYILFDADKPVAFLFCPVRDDVVLYQYLGYDPAYMNWSPGTVLQWHALEALFAERRFAYFDFTEGQSDHKRFFATGSVRCANVFFLRRNLRNLSLVLGHMGLDAVSARSGAVLEQLGMKARVKKLIRFGV